MNKFETLLSNDSSPDSLKMKINREIDVPISCSKLEIDKNSDLQKLLEYECLQMVEMPPKYIGKRSNFSIDYILGTNEKKDSNFVAFNAQYDWLYYTRYRPPKLQRVRKKECVQRRRLGRNPRIPFSNEQVAMLEGKFQKSPYLSNSDVSELSKCLQLSESRIKIWFQNRRARERKDGQDSTEKELNMIKSFIIKTRHPNMIPDDVQDLSISAFKPCNIFK